jgi:hypothetical protein
MENQVSTMFIPRVGVQWKVTRLRRLSQRWTFGVRWAEALSSTRCSSPSG